MEEKEPTFNSTDPDIEPTPKMYSTRAIGIATYLGGPLAASFLVRTNFLAQGKTPGSTQ